MESSRASARVTPTESSSPPITVRMALDVPALRAGLPEVKAGHAGLDRVVRWVHAGEVPNMASLLKGGELLLTTGMGLGGTAKRQREYMLALAECGIAGLAIELGTRLSRIPRPLVQAADERDVPLIAFNREVPFVTITEAIHRELVNHQVEVMRRGEQHQRWFTQLVLNGAGVPELLAELAQTIGNPVMLERAGRGVVYHASFRTPATAVLANWRAQAQLELVTHPVPATDDEVWGQLTAFAVDSELTELDRVAVEQAVGLIALALLRNEHETLLRTRTRGDFLARVLVERTDESELRAEAADLGFAPREPLLLPLVAARRDAGGSAAEHGWALVWKEAARELGAAGLQAIAGTRPAEGDLLVVVGLDSAANRSDLADRVTAALREAAARHFDDRHPTAIGVGACATTWGELREALGEAVIAALAGLSRPDSGWRDAEYPDVDRLIWRLGRGTDIEAFVDQRLGPLLAHDKERSLQLTETLEAYFANGCSKAKTARALHLERQSLYHRLERIEQLIGEPLEDDATALGLHLALRVRRVLRHDD